MVILDGMLGLVLTQHRFENSSMPLGFAILVLRFGAYGREMDVVGLDKHGKLFGVELCSGIYD